MSVLMSVNNSKNHHRRMLIIEISNYLLDNGTVANKRQAIKYIYEKIKGKYLKSGFVHDNFEKFYKSVMEYESRFLSEVEKLNIEKFLTNKYLVNLEKIITYQNEQ